MDKELVEKFIKVKCPDCSWSEFKDGEAVGMTPCHNCNSTGYIYKRIEDYGFPPNAGQRKM